MFSNCYFCQVEDELVNHVKVHQIFNILKEDFGQDDQEDEDEKPDPVLCMYIVQ